MAKRSMPNRVAATIKANQTKIAQFGPDELRRAVAQAVWTMAHKGQPKSENPHIRTKIYSPAVFAEVEKFKAWAKVNPGKNDSENPHYWDNRISN